MMISSLRRCDGGTVRMVETTLAVQFQLRQHSIAPRTAFIQRIGNMVAAIRTDPLLQLQLFFQGGGIGVHCCGCYITICETSPPTAKATTQVPIQITNPSFNPRSFIITIREAIHGTNNVMVTSATRICIGARFM